MDRIEAALEPLRALLKRQDWFETVEATIRVNAMRHGATSEQIEGFISGDLDFIGWMSEKIRENPPVRLCRDCKHHCPCKFDFHGRIHGPLAACAKSPNSSLKEARAQCLGQLWEASHG